MQKHFLSALLPAAGLLTGFLLFVPARGQFPAESTIPKKDRKSKKIKMGPSGPVPRTADGKVDLTGVWGYANFTSDLAKDYEPDHPVPFTALGEKLFKERQANEGVEDPEARCLPTGVPRRDPYPSKIIQTPNVVVILFEGNLHSFRQIFLDRKEHPKDLNPSWWGDSIGHWENNDTLVVDTVGFNGLTWLDLAGHPSSDQLHVTERYSRPDYGTLKWDITIEDPVMYTKPWSVTEMTPLMNYDLMEYVCTENERDSKHLDIILEQYNKSLEQYNKKK